jgi:hypothetical protein
MRGVVLGDDDATACLLVETVNDAGSFRAADSGKIRAMREQCIHERVPCVTRAGMNDKAGRLVDDNQVFVFMQNFEGDRLRLRINFFDNWWIDLHDVIDFHNVAVPWRAVVQRNEPVANQDLQSRARKFRNLQRKKTVEA